MVVLAAAVWAAETQKPKPEPQVFAIKANGKTVATLTLTDPEFQVPPADETSTVRPSTNNGALPPGITVRRRVEFWRKQDTKPWMVIGDGLQMEATRLK